MLATMLGITVFAMTGVNDVAIERRLVYVERSRRKLFMTLYRPEGVASGKRPGVVLLHGGAWIVGSRMLQSWYGRHLARHGYVAIAVEYRKMPRHPFPACLYDAKAAVRWLRRHAATYQVDPSRIAAFGDSAGGHLSLLLAATRPEDGLEFNPDECPAEDPEQGVSSAVQAAVSLYGPNDLSYYLDPKTYIRLGGITRRYIQRFVGAGQNSTGDPFKKASPVAYVHPRMCPVLLLHGTGDHLVPYDQVASFYQLVRAQNVPARLITVPRKGHGFDYIHPRIRANLFHQILGFLDEHLRPDSSQFQEQQ